MKRRVKLSKKRDRRVFSRTASRTHKKNIGRATVMRGGIRL